MCGRYALYGPVSRLKERFDLHDCPDFSARYNIAPTADVLIIRLRPGVGRVGQLVRWGLIPNWARDPSIGAKLNNARAEGIAEKPSFRTSFARHRCLIPARGFYEWKLVTENGTVRKQPYYVRPTTDDDFFAFAGLLARWRSPQGEEIISTCIITTAPNSVMAPIHDRMPAILAESDLDAWLDPENHDLVGLASLLGPADAKGMVAYPVSAAVNRAGVEGLACIEPIAVDDAIRSRIAL